MVELWLAGLQMQEKNKEDFKTFSKVLQGIRKMPFQTYDAEFVLENGQVYFTDLTIQSPVDIELMKTSLERNEYKNEKILSK